MFAASRKHLPAFVAGVGGVLVGATLLGGAAYAANGGSFLLGRSNTETATAALTNTAGSPLSLVAKAGYAPLRVNTNVKVPNLNADLLDGLDNTKFALATTKSGFTVSPGTVAVDGDQDLVTDYYAAYATCPAGTILTGGGGYAGGADDLFYSGPGLDPKVWEADSLSGPVQAYAVCVNLRGVLPVGVNPLGVKAPTTSSKMAKVR